jgi:hypothetical protein
VGVESWDAGDGGCWWWVEWREGVVWEPVEIGRGRVVRMDGPGGWLIVRTRKFVYTLLTASEDLLVITSMGIRKEVATTEILPTMPRL